MNSQAKSGIRLKATNHALGDKPASAELSFEPVISIAGEEGGNYHAKFRFYHFTSLYLKPGSLGNRWNN